MNDTECFQEAVRQWNRDNMFVLPDGTTDFVEFEDLSSYAQSEVLQLAQKIKDGQHEAKKTGN